MLEKHIAFLILSIAAAPLFTLRLNALSQPYGSPDSLFKKTVSEYGLYAFLRGQRALIILKYCIINKKTWKSNYGAIKI